MTNPRTKNLDIYGNEPLPWSRALALLEANASSGENTTYWLATNRPDGRPHIAGVGALWADGKIYVVSGEPTRKSKNLRTNANCAVSVSLKGMDLVLEGKLEKVTDEATVARIAEKYVAAGWPAKAEGTVFTAPYSAPSAGPAPWNLYEMTPVAAVGVASEEPYGATRWRFD